MNTFLQLVFAGETTISVVTLLQLLAALLTGAVIPIIFHYATRHKQTTDKLEDKADLTKNKLHAAEQKTLEEKLEIDLTKATRELADKAAVNELKQDLTTMRVSVASLQREFDKQLADCQQRFITSEMFRQGMDSQKVYLKFLIGFMKKQAANLLQGVSDDDPEE